MKHKIIDKQSLGSHQWKIIIELLPENDFEIKAIKQVDIMQATHTEKRLIDDYVSLCLGNNYSVLKADQNKNIFIIEALSN